MVAALADTINTVINAQLTRSRKKLLWAQIKSHVLYAWASEKGHVEMEDGGYELTNPLITGRNPNITPYMYYDEIPIDQTDEFSTVKYYFTRVAGSVMVSQQELDENRGDAKIFDIVSKKIDVLEESIQDKFGVYLYGIGAGRDPNGLALLVPNDPTTGSLAGVNRATNTWWRTSSYPFTGGGLNPTTIEQAFDDIQLDLTVKNEKPDIAICGRNIYRDYKQAVRDKFVIMGDGNFSSKKMYNLGFTGVMYGEMPLVYDEDCDPNTMYWLNSKYIRLHVLSHVNWTKQDLNAPWNLDVIGKRVVWQGQWCLWKAHRTHAVVTSA